MKDFRQLGKFSIVYRHPERGAFIQTYDCTNDFGLREATGKFEFYKRLGYTTQIVKHS